MRDPYYFDNQKLSFAIIEAFGNIEVEEKQKQVIFVLINILKTDKDGEVRNYATYSLANMGVLAKDAIKPLIEAGKTDPYQPVRIGSIRALVKIAPSQLETIQTLISVQKDPYRTVRNLGINYLSEVLRNIDSDVLDRSLIPVIPWR